MPICRFLRVSFVAISVAVGLFPTFAFSQEDVGAGLKPAPTVYLGAAKKEITLPLETPLAGFGKRHGRASTGVHDPLYARAAAISRGKDIFVFVSADLVLIDEELRKAVFKKIRKEATLPEDRLILFATHTHSGAGAIGGRFWERFIMGKKRKKVFEAVTDAIARSALGALKEKVPVSAEYGEVSIDKLVENRMDEKLNYLDRLRILRFKKTDGVVAGQMIFMAAHPTMLPASNLLFSADFPGVLTRKFEEEPESHPRGGQKPTPGVVALFVNGAAADLRPSGKVAGPFTSGASHLSPTEARFESMEAYGSLLFEKAREISFKEISLEGPWESKLERVKLPRIKIRKGFLRVPSFLGNRIFPRKTHIQAVRMGPLFFLAFPAEVASETGHHIERAALAKGLMPFVIGFANDYIAYVIPQRYYANQDHYEAQVSFYGKKLDWLLEKKAAELTDSLLTDEERKNWNRAGQLFHNEGIPVLRLTGNPYHVGSEEGRLLRNPIRQGTDDIFRYFRSELPIPLLNRLIINFLLDRAWKKMEPYVTYEEYEMMRGLAAGSGVSFRKIRRIHALPELYPTWCSNGAYWGPATKEGRLIAIRNLDWNREIGIHKHAAIKIYIRHPEPFTVILSGALTAQDRLREGSRSFDPTGLRTTDAPFTYVNIGYYGFTGVLSGMNARGISVGQIGATSSDETMEGVPMPFLLRRILAESESLDDAVEIFKRSDLTRGYNYVLADAIRKEAVAIETSRSHVAIFRDHDPKELEINYALPIKGAVFRGDPALDPTIRSLQWASKGDPEKPGLEPPAGSAYEIRYLKHGELVQAHYGKIDPEIAQAIAREIAPQSNIQSVIYAFPEFWVANAKGDLPAAQTKYVHFDFEELRKDAP